MKKLVFVLLITMLFVFTATSCGNSGDKIADDSSATQTDSQIDSQSGDDSESQTESKTESQTESQTDSQSDSQSDDDSGQEEKITITVTYDLGNSEKYGSSLKSLTQQLTVGEEYALSEPDMDKSDYSFDGWMYNGRIIATTGVWEIGENVTLVASYSSNWTGNY